MTIKPLLLLTVTAATFSAYAANNENNEQQKDIPSEQINIVKVIDFTKTRKTDAAKEANVAKILAATERAPMPEPEVIPAPKPTVESLDNEPVTKFHGKKGYSYTVRGKRYQTYAQSNGFVQQGVASWYGNPFHGRKTASGEIYNMNEMTAAHKELPLGTRVEVTNLSNGRKVIVRVNDRGPFHGNRVLDLSRAAAKELGTLQSGVARVRIRALH